jgi:hypothetical protein
MIRPYNGDQGRNPDPYSPYIRSIYTHQSVLSYRGDESWLARTVLYPTTLVVV